MKIFAFLIGLAQLPRGYGNPVANKFCTATCSGETDDWKSYSYNGVTTTGKALKLEPFTVKNYFKLTLSTAISKKLPKSKPGLPVILSVGQLPVLIVFIIYLPAVSRHLFTRPIMKNMAL